MNNQAAQTMPDNPELINPSLDDAWKNIITNYGLNPIHRDVAAVTHALAKFALSQTAGVPEGWNLVPVEPTHDMLRACISVVDLTQSDPEDHRYDDGHSDVRALWSAMLAAAPAASGGEDGLAAGIMAHFCNAIDNLNDMPVSDEWARKWTAKAEFLIGMGPDPGDQSLSDTPNQTPAASASERARELRERAEAHGGGVFVSVGDIRALEQALTQPSDAQRERDLLAEAIANAGLKCGLLRKDIEGLTGPQLLMVCDDMAQALTQQRGEVSWKHDAESWGNALNEAAWIFVEQCPEKSALLFNNTKAPLRAAILKYAELVGAATTPQPSADAVRELVEALQVAELALRERGLRACGEYKQIAAAIAKATNHQQNAAQGGGV